jgi:hexulose-6-phosphate isomerase
VPIRPSIRLSSLPLALPFAARMAVARAAGYEGLEVDFADGPASELRDAADAVGLAIHSVHNWENYSKPLSSPDPAVRDAGIEATLATLAAARTMGADTMLLVPGVVDGGASYGEVHRRSHDVIRSAILPEAERLGIVLAVENVWNGFLLSPFDCVRYVEQFGSPFVRFYLDVGNIIFGRPEGWIDIAGHLTVKLHLKDLRHWHDARRYRIVRIGEGDIDWPRVRDALARANFSGWAVMAEAESALPHWPQQAFYRVRGLRARFGANPALTLAETRLSQWLVSDAMRRFRRFVAPPATGG